MPRYSEIIQPTRLEARLSRGVANSTFSRLELQRAAIWVPFEVRFGNSMSFEARLRTWMWRLPDSMFQQLSVALSARLEVTSFLSVCRISRSLALAVQPRRVGSCDVDVGPRTRQNQREGVPVTTTATVSLRMTFAVFAEAGLLLVDFSSSSFLFISAIRTSFSIERR